MALFGGDPCTDAQIECMTKKPEKKKHRKKYKEIK